MENQAAAQIPQLFLYHGAMLLYSNRAYGPDYFFHEDTVHYGDRVLILLAKSYPRDGHQLCFCLATGNGIAMLAHTSWLSHVHHGTCIQQSCLLAWKLA